MKFLVDQAVSPIVAEWLRSEEGGGHDAIHARDIGMSAAADTSLFAVAVDESRVIVTTDLDFARITALSGSEGPGLILFRAGNVTDSQMVDLLRRVLGEVELSTLNRSVVVVDAASIRVSPLPLVRRS